MIGISVETTGTVATGIQARLAFGSTMNIAKNSRLAEIHCARGSLWITRQNDPYDHFIASGEFFSPDRDGLLVVCALADSTVEIRSKRLAGADREIPLSVFPSSGAKGPSRFGWRNFFETRGLPFRNRHKTSIKGDARHETMDAQSRGPLQRRLSYRVPGTTQNCLKPQRGG